MSKLVAWFGRSRKAVAAVVTPALAWATLVAAQPGSFQSITAVEWVSLAVGLATGLGVYQASNDAPPPAPAVPSVQPTIGSGL